MWFELECWLGHDWFYRRDSDNAPALVAAALSCEKGHSYRLVERGSGKTMVMIDPNSLTITREGVAAGLKLTRLVRKASADGI